MKSIARIFFSILTLLIAATTANAQKLTVESMTMEPMDLSASKYSRADLNGTACALVKVQIPLEGMVFEGNVMGDVENKAGEYWVYLTAGTKFFKIKHWSVTPLFLTFADYGLEPLSARTTYVLRLASPASATASQQTEEVIFKVTPADAVLFVDDIERELSNGMLKLMLVCGSHRCTVFSSGYRGQTDEFEVKAGAVNKRVYELDPKPDSPPTTIQTTQEQNKPINMRAYNVGGSKIHSESDELSNKDVVTADCLETADISTGKNLENDYLDLAKRAFEDRDYIKCYNLYKNGGLKQIDKCTKKNYGVRSESDIFPFVESCIALGKWDDAMHGITDNNVITNRKTWVNGIEWKLNPEDLKNWSKEKNPLMEHLLNKTYEYYCSNVGGLKYSPTINHVSKCRNLPVDKIVEKAATYFWNERGNWMSETPIRVAAELGHLEAQKYLGKYYLTGHNNDPVSLNRDAIQCDTVMALKWFEKAALSGDTESANIAAHFFLSGHGVDRDYAKAFSLYNMNISQNDYDSKYGLGLCYYFGYGVQRNVQSALSYLKEAEDWHPEVPFMIGNLYYMDNYNPEAIKYYNRALQRKNINSSVRYSILMKLSDCNRYGRCGLSVNIEEADLLLKEANKLEISASQNIDEYLISLTHISINHENN